MADSRILPLEACERVWVVMPGLYRLVGIQASQEPVRGPCTAPNLVICRESSRGRGASTIPRLRSAGNGLRPAILTTPSNHGKELGKRSNQLLTRGPRRDRVEPARSLDH